MDVLERQDIVLVRLSGLVLGFLASQCREVLPLLEPVPVPDWPRNALGMMDVRGVLIPVLDASPAVRRAPQPFTTRNQILVVEARGRPWGLVVDEVLAVGEREIRPVRGSEEALAGILHPSVVALGVVDHEGDPALVVDAPGLLEQLPSLEHPLDRAGELPGGGP